MTVSGLSESDRQLIGSSADIVPEHLYLRVLGDFDVPLGELGHLTYAVGRYRVAEDLKSFHDRCEQRRSRINAYKTVLSILESRHSGMYFVPSPDGVIKTTYTHPASFSTPMPHLVSHQLASRNAGSPS